MGQRFTICSVESDFKDFKNKQAAKVATTSNLLYFKKLPFQSF